MPKGNELEGIESWNKIFKEKGREYNSPMDKMPKLVKLFKENDVKKILDVGCGSGRHVVYLSEKGFEVYGIDIAKEGIKIVKDRLEKRNLKANLKRGNVFKKLPYKDNFFDAIISLRVINHGKKEEIKNLVKEMERVLKAGGLIFITVSRPSEVSKEELPKLKKLGPRTSLNLEGEEAGVIHYLFNEEILRKIFSKKGNFEILDLHVDSEGYYCLLAHLKNTQSSK